MTRKVLRPKVDSLSNMTGQAMWNKFVNVSEHTPSSTEPTTEELKAASAAELEEQLDWLSIDFASMSGDINSKHVSCWFLSRL